MKAFNAKEFILKQIEKIVIKEESKARKIDVSVMTDDPFSEIVRINKEFADLLNNSSKLDRFTDEFNKKIKKLNDEQIKQKDRIAKGYDIVKEMDKSAKQSSKANLLRQEFENMKFTARLR